MGLNETICQIRHDFPALNQTIHNGKRLVYLDNAATTQKPQEVLDTLREAYITRNANIHRGTHYLSREATEAHEEARRHTASFLHAQSSDEIIFTRGTTEGINLIASTYCPRFMLEGDEVIITAMEHHSNIVPWQMQRANLGIRLVVVPIYDDGTIDMKAYQEAFSKRTKLVAVCHSSNVLGTVNPIQEMTRIAHEHDVPILIDGAQTIAHRPIDVQALDADFFAFSAHKAYGPTGIGALYGKRKWLEELPPYQGGGEMIESVTFEETTYNELPYKFEAGTPDFIGSVGMASALKYIRRIGFDTIQRIENDLLTYATERLSDLPGIQMIGQATEREAVISFDVDGIHHFDLGTLLDTQGIAIRTGHHCAQPLMSRYGLTGTARISFACYNTREEIDLFIDNLQKSISILH